MLIISALTPVLAWRESLRQLHENGLATDNDKYYRDELALIEVSDPCIEPVPIDFPMSQHDIDAINHYIVTGADESLIVHDWTKLYYHRINDEPHNQYEFLLRKLSTDPLSGRSQIVLWDKYIDQDGEKAPCTQVIWARQKFGKLEVHVHAASVDAYKKMLMNIQEFVSLQLHIAKELGLEVGKFYHLIDSCHIYNVDVASMRHMIIE